MTARYEHVQETPEAIWTVRHNLFTRSPVVDVFVDFDGVLQKMMPKAIVVVSALECRIEWSVPRTGRVGVI